MNSLFHLQHLFITTQEKTPLIQGLFDAQTVVDSKSGVLVGFYLKWDVKHPIQSWDYQQKAFLQ